MPKIITWDYKEQPDWDEVNSALSEQPDAIVHPIDTQSDQFGVVIGPSDMTAKEAQQHYDETCR